MPFKSSKMAFLSFDITISTVLTVHVCVESFTLHRPSIVFFLCDVTESMVTTIRWSFCGYKTT